MKLYKREYGTLCFMDERYEFIGYYLDRHTTDNTIRLRCYSMHTEIDHGYSFYSDGVNGDILGTIISYNV